MLFTSCGNIDNPLEELVASGALTPELEPATVTITADDLKLYVDDTDTRIGTASTGATVTYASSDESIATVDANGKVTAVGVGTATITASVDPTEKFTGASATYKVVVLESIARLNPLYYLTESDVTDISAAGVVTFDNDPTTLTGKTIYKWSEAMSNYAKQPGVYDEYWNGHTGKTITDDSNEFYYHLPCLQEWNTIIPADFSQLDNDGNMNPNIFGTDFYQDGGCTFKKTSGVVTYVDWPADDANATKCVFGYDATTQAGIKDYSYWNPCPTQTDVRYAIRFLGTDYCSVWKYETKDNGVFDNTTFNQFKFVITAKLINKLEKTDASLESILAEYMAKDDAWWNNNNPNAGAVQRVFYTFGYLNNGESARSRFNEGFYWSTTYGNRTWDEARALSISNKNACIGSETKPDSNNKQLSVRLFREPKE
jgi:hypothetical protein